MSGVEYGTIWADLPMDHGTKKRCRDWLRGRSWRTPGGEENLFLDFVRPKATPIMVSREAHEKLRGYLEATTAARRAALACVIDNHAKGIYVTTVTRKKSKTEIGMNPGGPKEIVTQRVGMTPTHVKTVLDDLRAQMKARGFAPESTAHECRFYAAKTALRILAAFVAGGRPLILDRTEGLPGALSVRLGIGQNYYEMIRPVDGYPDWIQLGELGYARPAPKGWVAWRGDETSKFPDRCEMAKYVEIAHVDQAWHARFVFMNLYRPPVAGEDEDEPSGDDEKENAKRVGVEL